jgi:hypothetical protein
MQKVSRSDWLVCAIALKVGEAVRIQPRENLTVRDAVEALDAQGAAGYRVMEHGTVMWVRRLSEDGKNWISDERGREVAPR